MPLRGPHFSSLDTTSKCSTPSPRTPLSPTLNRPWRGRKGGTDEEEEVDRAMAWFRLLVSDFLVSFLWVWSGSILRYLAYRILGLGMHPVALMIKGSVAVVYVYCFSLLGKATGGGAYNPLMVLCYAISGNFSGFLFTVCGRIPAQVIGSIIGVWLINATSPAAAHGPLLNVDVHRGALIEGLLTFLIVLVSLGLKKVPKSSSMKRWISSISKVIFHILASDITGGIMNPATAFGWAYAQGKHLTRDHLCVYWLAPMEGTLLGVWTCNLFDTPQKLGRRCWKETKFKSE